MELLNKKTALMFCGIIFLQGCYPLWFTKYFYSKQQEAFFSENTSPQVCKDSKRLRTDGYYTRKETTVSNLRNFILYDDGTFAEFKFKDESTDSDGLPDIDLVHNIRTWVYIIGGNLRVVLIPYMEILLLQISRFYIC